MSEHNCGCPKHYFRNPDLATTCRYCVEEKLRSENTTLKFLIEKLVTACKGAEKKMDQFVRTGYLRPESTATLSTVIEKAERMME